MNKLELLCRLAFNDGKVREGYGYQYCDWIDVKYLLKLLGKKEKDYKINHKQKGV